MIKGLLDMSARVFRADSPNPRMLQEVSEQERRLIDLCVRPVGEALAALDAGLRGLSSEEADKRLDEYGLNELSHTRRMGFLADILQRCRSPLVVQLLNIASISGAIGEIKSAIIVSAMVSRASGSPISWIAVQAIPSRCLESACSHELWFYAMVRKRKSGYRKLCLAISSCCMPVQSFRLTCGCSAQRISS